MAQLPVAVLEVGVQTFKKSKANASRLPRLTDITARGGQGLLAASVIWKFSTGLARIELVNDQFLSQMPTSWRSKVKPKVHNLLEDHQIYSPALFPKYMRCSTSQAVAVVAEASQCICALPLSWGACSSAVLGG